MNKACRKRLFNIMETTSSYEGLKIRLMDFICEDPTDSKEVEVERECEKCGGTTVENMQFGIPRNVCSTMECRNTAKITLKRPRYT